MKKLGLLAFAASLAVAGIGAVGAIQSQGNEAPSFDVIRRNATATSENLYQRSTEGAHLPGNAVYGQIEDDAWFTYAEDNKLSCESRICFALWVNTTKYEAWTDVLTFAYNTENEWKHVYQGVVPAIPTEAANAGATSWTVFQLVRMKPNTSGDWANMYHNCSGDQQISSTNNVIYIYNDNGWGYSKGKIDASERLRVFAFSQGWLKPAGNGSTCTGSNLDQATLEKEWGDAGTSFGTLGLDVKSKLSMAVAAADADAATQPTVPGTAARYDWIYKKYKTLGYNLSNWADRTIA